MSERVGGNLFCADARVGDGRALREDEREDSVRAARRGVHVRRRHCPRFVAFFHEESNVLYGRCGRALESASSAWRKAGARAPTTGIRSKRSAHRKVGDDELGQIFDVGPENRMLTNAKIPCAQWVEEVAHLRAAWAERALVGTRAMLLQEQNTTVWSEITRFAGGADPSPLAPCTRFLAILRCGGEPFRCIFRGS